MGRNWQDGPVRAADVLEVCPDATLGAEVGVYRGGLSRALLSRSPDLRLYMVDSWGAPVRSVSRANGEKMAASVRRAPWRSFRIARQNTEFASDRRAFLVGDSVAVAQMVPDGVLDFAYIDASHAYEAVKEDLEAWCGKLKPRGWLCGHDYRLIEGVTRAVDEFRMDRGLTLSEGVLSNWFVRMD